MRSLQVRDLPEHIYQQIVQLANIERRSITQETIILLESALEIKNHGKKRRKQLLDCIVQETGSACSKRVPFSTFKIYIL
ncbi:MAG: hypothetical protein LRZ99_02070, partial [Desulfotomaculum sp.]|nr:hypothetical protein [Desulfotomaculum sp.]